MSMINRLQEQAQGFQNIRERGAEAMANFDTDKAITQGTEIAYRHGTALLDQGRKQLEAMAGTELVAGAHMALPPLIKTAKAIYDAQNPPPIRTPTGVDRPDGRPIDPESFAGQQAKLAQSRVRQLGGGDGDTLGTRIQDGAVQMINKDTGEVVGNERYDSSLRSRSGLRGDPTLQAEREARLANPIEPRQSRVPVPDRVSYDEGDMFSQRAGARQAQARFNQATAEQRQIQALPSYEDPQAIADRPPPATGEARTIEPQVQPQANYTRPGTSYRVQRPAQAPASAVAEPQAEPPAPTRISMPRAVQYEEGTAINPVEVSGSEYTAGNVRQAPSISGEPQFDPDQLRYLSQQADRTPEERLGIGGGNETSRIGQPAQGSSEPFITKPPVEDPVAGLAETGAKVGGEEAVGGILDAIPGLDLLGAAIGIAGLASGIKAETGNRPTVAPPTNPAPNRPEFSTAFDSAPVFDSSDYHSM